MEKLDPVKKDAAKPSASSSSSTAGKKAGGKIGEDEFDRRTNFREVERRAREDVLRFSIPFLCCSWSLISLTHEGHQEENRISARIL